MLQHKCMPAHLMSAVHASITITKSKSNPNPIPNLYPNPDPKAAPDERCVRFDHHSRAHLLQLILRHLGQVLRAEGWGHMGRTQTILVPITTAVCICPSPSSVIWARYCVKS